MSEHIIMADEDAFYADGQRTTIAALGAETMIELVAARAGCSRAVAADVLEEIQEHMAGAHASQPAANALAEFEEKFIDELVRMRAVNTDCLVVVTGFGHKIDCHCTMDLVKRHGGGKAAKAGVNKWFKSQQRRLGTPLLPSQRGGDGIKNMHAARKKQLKP